MSTQYLYPPTEPLILIERVFDAPRQLVWDAFTKPEHFARWWGPRKYQSIVLEHDFRVGGKWRIRQVSADAAHEFFGEILAIEAPVTTTQTFCFRDFPPVTESFILTELGQNTLFKAEMRFSSIEARYGMAASGMEGGANESYERLDELLAELVSEKV